MAIRIVDGLAKIIGTDFYSIRTESFLWFSLAQVYPEFAENQGASSDFRSTMESYLKRDSKLTLWIRHTLQSSIIPENHLNWLIESQRQALWMERYIAQSGSSLIPDWSRRFHYLPKAAQVRFTIPHHLRGRNKSIAIFDYWAAANRFTVVEIIEHSKSMEIAWQASAKIDQYFDWLAEGEAEEKRKFFWRWLELKNNAVTFGRGQFQSHDELLAFSDDKFTDAEKELFSKSAKKIWTQQQRRANLNDKKQCNFVLSVNTISNLEKLVTKYGLTRTEIIELIIDSEVKDELHIKARLHRKSLLTTPL